MDEKRVGIAWVVAVLVLIAAGTIYVKTRPPRYQEPANGLLRIDRETGRKHIFVNGRWQPAPEINRADLQSKIEASLAEHMERQLAVPTFELRPAEGGTAPPAPEKK